MPESANEGEKFNKHPHNNVVFSSNMRVLEYLHQNKTEGKWKEIKPERGVEGGLNALKKRPEPAAAHPARNQPGRVYPPVPCPSAQGSIYLIHRLVYIDLPKIFPGYQSNSVRIESQKLPWENNRFLPDPILKFFSGEF